MSPSEIYTGSLHFTKNTHQDLEKYDIDDNRIEKVWIVYLQSATRWFEIDFHVQAISDARRCKNLGSVQKGLYEFSYEELGHAPDIYVTCAASNTGEAKVTKKVKTFGVVKESIGMRNLLREFGDIVRKSAIPIDEVCYDVITIYPSWMISFLSKSFD